MPKVRILSTCSACQGKAYIPVGEATSATGGVYIQYKACPICDGSGNQPQWVTLEEFARLLQPYLCQHTNTTFTGGMHFSTGDV